MGVQPIVTKFVFNEFGEPYGFIDGGGAKDSNLILDIETEPENKAIEDGVGGHAVHIIAKCRMCQGELTKLVVDSGWCGVGSGVTSGSHANSFAVLTMSRMRNPGRRFKACPVRGEQPFAYAYMSEGDPIWRELQVIFNDAPSSPELFIDNVINISSSEDKESMYIVENGGVLFGPVVEGMPVVDIPYGEYEVPVNAPFLQAVPLINVSSDDTLSPDNAFWNDMYEEWATDTDSDGYGDPTDDGLVFSKDEAIVNFPNKQENEPLSPINSINSLTGFISPSSSSSNCPSFGS
ncbi:hypothetical protein BUALT_Bualt09G0025100 [Buddleja alternifolia]|uniref:Uncharacterized protein n=1 Tax=Buddleja alternifolia TaxID=168488 RepID=A0AAV6X0R2_9LAMI|nr:hypothetical protein BUALT_Bualt09G0025100 [Buddleja alternifolia]